VSTVSAVIMFDAGIVTRTLLSPISVILSASDTVSGPSAPRATSRVTSPPIFYDYLLVDFMF
jgi:hypothetical protein